MTETYSKRIKLANQYLTTRDEYTTDSLIDEFNTKNEAIVARHIQPSYIFSKYDIELFSKLYNPGTFISTKCAANKRKRLDDSDFEREVAAYTESRNRYKLLGTRYPAVIYFDNPIFALDNLLNTLTQLRHNIGVREIVAGNFDINILRVIPKLFNSGYNVYNDDQFDLESFILQIVYLTEKPMFCVCYRDVILPKELDYVISKLTNSGTYETSDCHTLDFKVVAKIIPKVLSCPAINKKTSNCLIRILDWDIDNFSDLLRASSLFVEYLSKITLFFNIEQHRDYLLNPTLLTKFRNIPDEEWHQILARMLMTIGMSSGITNNINYLISLRDNLSYDSIHVVNEYDLYGFSPSLYAAGGQSIILFDLDCCLVAIDYLVQIDNYTPTTINDMSLIYYISRVKNLIKFGRAYCSKQLDNINKLELYLTEYLSNSVSLFGHYLYSNYSI
jgi:hypothetical protein